MRAEAAVNALTSSPAVAQLATPTTLTTSPAAVVPSNQSTPRRAPLPPPSSTAHTPHDACQPPSRSLSSPHAERRAHAAAAAAVPPASALRFTCCRCRRPFLVVPGAPRCYPSPRAPAVAPAAAVQPAAPSVSASPAEANRVPFTPTTPHTLEAVVRASHTTAGTARHYRPLPGPRQETEVALGGAAAPAVTSTRVYHAQNFDEDSSGSGHGGDDAVALSEDPALLAALPLDLFSASAELLSTAQLTDLLHRAHRAGTAAASSASNDVRRYGSLRGVAGGSSLCVDAPVTAEPRSSPLNGTCSTAPASDAAAAAAAAASASPTTAAAAAVVSVLQLRDFGVTVLPASAGCLPRTPQPAKGRSPVLWNGRRSARAHDAEVHAPSPPLASSTSTLPPPSLTSLRTEDELEVVGGSSEGDSEAGAAAAGDGGASTPTPTATPPPPGAMSVDLHTPLTHPVVEDDVAASELQLAELESWATPPARRLHLESLPPRSASAAASTLSFEEQCRRWMRLLARSAPPYEQPVCRDCWQECCLAPLQQRVRLAVDTAQTLTAASASPASTARLMTMCCSADSSPPPPPRCDRGHGRHVGTTAMLVRGLPLDAVAANLFGDEAESLLSSLEALSAPHARPHAARHVDAHGSSMLQADFSVSASELGETGADNADTEVDGACRAMQQELEELTRQQARVDRQLGELRSVLQALDATPLAVTGATGDCNGGHGGRGAEGWPALAAAHNRREVHRAFTIGDEAAERQRSMAHLRTSFAYVFGTSIDAFAFPVHVAGPIGLIAGLRLGLVPPYTGSAGGAACATDEPCRGTTDTSAGSVLSSSPSASQQDTEVPAETVCLDGFVHRQVTCAQLLLSGNTSADSGDALGEAAGLPGGRGSAAAVGVAATTSAAAATAAAAPAASANTNVRVSPAEVNAACGYLLLLLNYLAHVNGFSFQSAVLRPAGDRSTVGLLKRVPIAGQGGSGASAAAAGVGSNASTGFSLWGLFRGAAAQPVPPASPPPPQQPASGGDASPRRSTRGSAAAATTYVVDSEVDFYMTDRLLAWRTFGPACVAVAACVKELADALHESLRCWRLREGMVRRPAPAGGGTVAAASSAEGEESAPPSVAATQRSTALSTLRSARTAARSRLVPVPLPRLVEELCAQHELALQNSDLYMSFPTSAAASTVAMTITTAASAHAERGLSVPDSSGRATPTPTARSLPLAASRERLEPGTVPAAPAPLLPPTTPHASGAAAAPPPALAVPFPVQPPFAIRGDTVDGFSVRHGSVTEAIWTLGMKKLLANVQWCMAATMELERLYAVTGEEGQEEEEEGDVKAGGDSGGVGHT